MKVFDFRSRPPYKKFAENFLYSKESLEHFYKQFGFSSNPSAEQRSMKLFMEEMDTSGVEKAVVPLRKWNSDLSNDILVDMMNDYPDRFYGFANIDPRISGYSDAMKELDTYVLNGPCIGANFEPVQSDTPKKVNDEYFYPLYETLQKNNVVTMITFGGNGYPNLDYNNPKYIDQVAKDFPDLKIVLSHGGWPYVTEVCSVAYNRPNLYLAAGGYVINTPGCNDYIMAANYYLQDRILYASIYPLVSIPFSVQYYLQCGIKEEALEKVMYKNAMNLLGLA